MNDMKTIFRGLGALAIVIAVGIAVYALAGQAFTLPLGLLSLVLGLAALWLQGESK